VIDVRVGLVDEVPVGEGRAFQAGDEMVAVFRLRDGAVRAVSAVCPHSGGPIADGQIDASVVVCPLHLYSFELSTGRSLANVPAMGALRSYPVRVDEGWLVVTV
jgi:nitrite reductase (NADH) small subunit